MNFPGRGIAIAFLFMFSVESMTSCSLLYPETIETKTEVLNKIPLVLPARKTHAATLLVFAPDSQPIYDTTKMAYTITPYQVAYFSQHEWGETPSQMLHPLLVQTLENAHFFKAVITPPYSGSYSYALRTEILELIQDFTSDPVALQLSLRFQLRDGATDTVIATQEIQVREPMEKKTAEAGVLAANNAVAKALLQLVKFLHAKAK
jgi:cholesterol transport system auxiliary component